MRPSGTPPPTTPRRPGERRPPRHPGARGWSPACLEGGPNPPRSAGSSISPAVQNMLLAARALGLGSTLTTRHIGYEKEVDAAMGIPSGFHSYAILPIGYPMGRFGPVGRGP